MKDVIYIDSRKQPHLVREMPTVHLSNALNKLKRNMESGSVPNTIANIELKDAMEEELKKRDNLIKDLPTVNYPGKNKPKEINDEF